MQQDATSPATDGPAPPRPLQQWWFGRFQLRRGAPGMLHVRDMLMPAGRDLPEARFAGLDGRALERAWFRHGFVPPALSAACADITDRPVAADDALFWQFPCRTEGAAWDHHAALDQPGDSGDDLHTYLGLPWATWIDKERKQAWGADRGHAAGRQWRLVGVRLSGLHQALAGLGMRLRVHTVCQHIYWQDLLPRWRQLGVTDLWLSHCPAPGTPAAAEALAAGMQVHPWRLFAVNVEDPARTSGLLLGRDAAERPLLASFVGAHADHYLSDIRLRLRALADAPDVVVRVTGRWHFEDLVYRHQVQGEMATAPVVDESVHGYNALLSDSVFSLCPAGAGANTLRLWESLASGAIPVMLGDWPQLPAGGSLPPLDWDAALVRVRTDELPGLLDRLRAMPLDERRQRQQRGMALFTQVQQQTCF